MVQLSRCQLPTQPRLFFVTKEICLAAAHLQTVARQPSYSIPAVIR